MTREEITQAVFVFTRMDCTIITVKVEDKATKEGIYRTFDLYYKPHYHASIEEYIGCWMDKVTMTDYDNYLISMSPGYNIPDDTDLMVPDLIMGYEEGDGWDEMLDDVRSRYRTRVERSK